MEHARSTSRGGFFVRSIFTFLLTVFVAALLWVTFSGQDARAADEPKANWKGESIIYDGHQYYAAEDAKAGESHGLPQGTHYYVYVEQVSERPLVQKAHVIYFAPSADPPKATDATYVVYDLAPDKTYSNPQGQKAIAVTERGESDQYADSCSVDGIGWIVCPVTVFLAQAMDWVFDVLSGMIAVQPPVTGNSNSDLYVAWNVMRSIANIAFIIAFLLIIYSQLTNLGISNYGLKKLAPRLIIAAILVNLSFYICAIAVDISNIAGYSLQDILVQIRESTFNIDNNTWAADVTSWEQVTTFVLSGGTAAGIGIVTLLMATGGTVSGAIFLLIPVLLGVLLTVLFVLLILAARQAIIIILIVVAPLAFVAYLLPNTEKWFQKWREVFTTMLVFFPAFSLVFGGSQLAGGIIIQNANSIIMMIFGMAVQVAPLVITPLILKLSGNLLGRIAGIINDPRKGLLDRTRNWSNMHAERQKQRGIGGDLKGYNFARRAARGLTYNKHRVERDTERWKSKYEEYAKNRDQTTARGQRIETDAALSKLNLEDMDADFNQAVQEARGGDRSGLDRIRMRGDATLTERITARLDGVDIDVVKQRRVDTRNFNKFAEAAVKEAVRLDESSRVIAEATASAQRMQQVNFGKRIKEDDALAKLAGGIDPNGAQRAIANATALLAKARNETIENTKAIIDDLNLTGDQLRTLAEGIAIPGIKLDITQDTRAAALQMVLGGPDTQQVAKAMETIDFSFAGAGTDADRRELQVIAAKALESNSSKPPEVGAGVTANMKQGLDFAGNVFSTAYGEAGMDAMIISAINREKLDAGKLQGAGKDYADTILRAVRNAAPGDITAEARARLMLELGVTLDPNREASEKLGDSRKVLEDIASTLGAVPPTGPTAGPPTPPPSDSGFNG